MNNELARRKALLLGAGAVVVLASAALWSARDVIWRSSPKAQPPMPSTGSVMSSRAIAAMAMPATVRIRTIDALGNNRGDGTGFFAGTDGLIATNLHVIRGAYALEVSTLYGKTFDSVRFVAADARHDLAILRVNVTGETAIPLAHDAEPQIGDRVFVLGNPLGQTGTFSDGMVSALRPAAGITFIQVSAPVGPGSSGGPVMNDRGEVIGVTTMLLQRGQSLNFAIPVRYLRALVKSAGPTIAYSRLQLPLLRRPGVVTTESGEAHQTDDERKEDVITRQLRGADSLMQTHGGRPMGEAIRASLAAADTLRRFLNLVAGNDYVITGYCDDHCSALSLTVATPKGVVLDADVETDDRPKIRFTAPMTGKHELRVDMSECDVTKCRLGVRVFTVEKRAAAIRPRN